MSDTCMIHLERYWKTLTTSSNEQFNQQNYLEALKGYKEALYRAEVLNNHWKQCFRLKIPVLQVYLISCNNLAYTYEELGDLEKAQAFLKRAIYFLIYRIEENQVFGKNIQGDLKRALLSYVDFTQRTQFSTPQDTTFNDLVNTVIQS